MGGERYVPTPEATWGELYAALRRIDADDRDSWVKVGMALHSTGEIDRAFQIWDEWSRSSAKYDQRDQMRVWRSFHGRGLEGVTYRTVFALAKDSRDKRDNGGTFAGQQDERIKDGFLSAADFAASAASPDYVLDGILRRGYLYALTGMSNAGKTSIGLRMVRCVNLGENFGPHECVRGRALILAGENPDDVAYRFMAEAQHNSMSRVDATFPATTVLPFSFAIEQGLPFIADRARQDGGYALVLVDSKAAYFGGDKEDDNAQAFRHARFLRELTMLEGRPAVVVICHPIKRPESAEALLPRGGSAFLNEIDGNLTAWKPGGHDIIEMHHTKIRGVPFDKLNLRLSVLELAGLKTSKGKLWLLW